MCVTAFLILSVQRERDVKESILFMAKQSGSIDPDVSTGWGACLCMPT